MTYGYARCSTNDTMQDVERQCRELRAAGAETVRHEYEHGDAAHKTEQDALMREMQEGDTLIVTEVSRLSRSTQQLCGIIETVERKHIRLVILNSITIDCRSGSMDAMSKAFLQMAGVFAELEKSMISARVKSGIANAKAKGKQVGRPERSVDTMPDGLKKYYALYASHQISVAAYARLANVTRSTVYHYLKVIEGIKA